MTVVNLARLLQRSVTRTLLRMDGLGTLLYCPVPDSGMGGENTLLDMIWTLAVRVPVAVGENWTKKVQVLKPWPAATN